MNMNADARALEILKATRAGFGPDPFEVLLRASNALPAEWRRWPAERCFQYLRCRLRFTQDELAQKAGLTQSQISRLEAGADALFDTWRRAYAAMGFELILLPVSGLTRKELEVRAEEGRPSGHWLRERARPRRLWRDK